jgi:hypothetical protein
MTSVSRAMRFVLAPRVGTSEPCRGVPGGHRAKLDKLVADFGGFTTKDLELRSTIVYLSDSGQPRADLINRVHEVKPHFSPAQIDGAITELEKKGYVD